MASHPGADLLMENVGLPEPGNKNIHVEQPGVHSLSSSIARACSSVTISASSPGENTKKLPSLRTGVRCFKARLTRTEVASPTERERSAAYCFTCRNASSLKFKVVLIRPRLPVRIIIV